MSISFLISNWSFIIGTLAVVIALISSNSLLFWYNIEIKSETKVFLFLIGLYLINISISLPSIDKFVVKEPKFIKSILYVWIKLSFII